MPATPPPRLLPEWAPQSGVLLTWPHGHSDWAGELAAIEAEYTALAAAIAARESVLIGCHDETVEGHVRERLAHAGVAAARCRLHRVPSNDTWVRDYGPLTVERDGRPRLVAFSFNAWGGKYPHAEDARISARLHAAGAFGALPLQREALVAEAHR
ncbi:MAG TPA: agmatine deiminase family protein [Gammaproteobacteria bacterium]